MRPDRIVVGEVRGRRGARPADRAVDRPRRLALARSTPASPAEALRRVETLALMAGLGLPHAALREQVADAFDLVVCQARGRRRRAPRRRGRRGRPRRGRRGGARALRLARRPRPLAGRALATPLADRGCAGGRRMTLAGSRARRSRRGRRARACSARGSGSRRSSARGVAAALGARSSSRSRAPGARGASRAAPERRRLAVLAAGALMAAGWLLGGAGARAARRARRPGRWRSRVVRARGAALRRASCGAARRTPPARWPTRSAPATRSAARSRAAPASRAPRAASCARAARALALGEPTEAVLERLRAARRLRRRGTRWSPGSCSSATPAATSRRCCATSPRSLEAAARAERDARRGHRPGALHRPARARAPGRRGRCSPSSPRPGFALACLADPLPAALIAAAAALQLAAVLAVRRLAR